MDGILSVYVLVESAHALAHRRTIIEAAEMGDFWGWGGPSAQRLFQGITRLMGQGGEPQALYAEAFRRAPGLIDGTDPDVRHIDASLAPLRDGVGQIERGRIARRQRSERFVHYVVPRDVAGDDDDRAAYVPEFNEAISGRAVLWPHARARWDAERVCLVSIERSDGWFHDLWLPGYLWADTEGRWLVPGLVYHDGMSSYEVRNERLIAAVAELQRQETAPGQWGLGGTSLPWGKEMQKRFPLVGRFLDVEGRAAMSHIEPEHAARVFAPAFG